MRLTPAQLGHRAAAQGEGVHTCPFPVGSPTRPDYKAWFTAYDRVEQNRAAGRDPNGHQPINPHLCVRDVTKVCNCCTRCTSECRREPGVPLVVKAAPLIGSVVLYTLRTAVRVVRAVERFRAAVITPDPVVPDLPPETADWFEKTLEPFALEPCEHGVNCSACLPKLKAGWVYRDGVPVREK